MRGGLSLVLVAAAVTTIAVVSDSTRQPPEKLRPGPPQTVAREVKLTAAMRRGIDRTLARFVPAAVERQDPALAWRLAGPGLRAGGSLRDWQRGELPVHPYDFVDKGLRDWTLVSARADRVAIDLMLFPPPESRDGPIAFGIDLVPGKAGWLVDSIFPAAIWSGKDERPFVTGAQDFTGKFGSKKSTYDKPKLPERRLAAAWMLVPALILGASILAPLAILTRGLLRRRRRPLEPLPQLPSTVSRSS